MRYLFILLVLSSCSTSLYTPNTRNAPLFREQGEAQLSGYLTSGGFEAQGAYALTDHIAVTGGYSFMNSKESAPISYTRKNSYGEIGLGLFDRTRSFRYEVIAGYGFGQATTAAEYSFFGVNKVNETTGKMSQLIYIQPTIGTNNQNFNLLFTPRVSLVNYSQFEANGVVKTPTNKSTNLFIEPTMTAKFKLAGNIHGIFQLGLTVPGGADVYFQYNTISTSLGIQIDTGGMKTRVFRN
jgi:hypothetical protein